MTTFNTNTARDIADNNQAFTSLDVAKNLLAYLETDTAKGLSAKTNMLELFNIGEYAARRGAYQVTFDLFADLQWALRINEYTIWAVRVPGLNHVVFHLMDGQWRTRTKSNVVVKDFLSKLVADEKNNRMFEKR